MIYALVPARSSDSFSQLGGQLPFHVKSACSSAMIFTHLYRQVARDNRPEDRPAARRTENPMG